MKLVVDPIWSWPIVGLAIAALLATVLVTYPKRLQHLSTFYRRLLLTLRFASAVVLMLAMIRPAIQFTETDKKSSVLAILGDKSRSMGTADGPGGITRRQALLKTMAECKQQIEKLGKEIEIRYFDFDNELHPVDEPSEEPDGEQTAHGAVMEALLRETQSRRVVSVVLLGDGSHRAIAPFDADPRIMARRLGELQLPVHTVAIGASELSGTAIDVSVEDLLVAPVVFEKKIVPVTAKVRVLGAAGRRFTLKLLVEDRSATKPGESGEMIVPPAAQSAVPTIQLQTQHNSDLIPVELSFVPNQAGEFKLRLQAVPLEGELVRRNNQLETLITVRKGGVNVAYFDIERAEQKFIRMVNEAEQIQIDVQHVRTGKLKQPKQIEADWFERDKYDVYIIGDVPADSFGSVLLKELAARVDEGAGLLMIGGIHSFGPGGYATTQLNDLLPVAMRPTEIQNAGQIATDLHHLDDLVMLPTAEGLNHYVMRIDPDGNHQQRWQSLAALQGANRLQRKNEFVQVLARSAEGVDLLFAHEVFPARVMAFAGDTTWLWVLQGQRDVHQRFWRQLILWLARKELDSDQPVWVRVDPRNYRSGSEVTATFGATQEDGTPIVDADFNVRVVAPNGEEMKVVPQRAGDESSAEFTQTDLPGDYWVTVSASKDGQSLGLDATTRFLIDERDLELDNPAADPALLEEISALTGGRAMRPEELADYFDRLLDNGIPSVLIKQVTSVNLWDNWYFLGLFVALMSVEWFIRKRRGFV